MGRCVPPFAAIESCGGEMAHHRKARVPRNQLRSPHFEHDTCCKVCFPKRTIHTSFRHRHGQVTGNCPGVINRRLRASQSCQATRAIRSDTLASLVVISLSDFFEALLRRGSLVKPHTHTSRQALRLRGGKAPVRGGAAVKEALCFVRRFSSRALLATPLAGGGARRAGRNVLPHASETRGRSVSSHTRAAQCQVLGSRPPVC